MKIRISAPARLHLGDIDPFGVGRFGYAPILAIEGPRTVVEACVGEGVEVEGLEAPEAEVYLRRVVEAFHLPGAKVSVISTAPRHSGFGSTTQLALTIGRAVTLAHGLDIPSVELLTALKRTSTGGVHLFQQGGFAVVGGLKVRPGEPLFERTEPLYPPLILRAPFPEDWRFILVTPYTTQGSPHGEVEEEVFKKLRVQEPPSELIHKAYFLLASRLVPAVLEEDAETFGEALTEIQMLVGRIYQPVQGSIFNPASQWIIPILQQHGALGVGQTSWGPTVYAFIHQDVEKMVEVLQEDLKGRAELLVVRADNKGARTEVVAD